MSAQFKMNVKDMAIEPIKRATHSMKSHIEIRKATIKAARIVHARWIRYASGGQGPGFTKIKNPGSGSNSYANSIHIKTSGILGVTVYTNSPYASLLEKGSKKKRDLKKVFAGSSKAKVSKKGGWYLIIPLKKGQKTVFRTVSNKSKGWVISKYPKKSIMRAALDNSQREIMPIIRRGMKLALKESIKKA